jgi:hypothetical protein
VDQPPKPSFTAGLQISYAQVVIEEDVPVAAPIEVDFQVLPTGPDPDEERWFVVVGELRVDAGSPPGSTCRVDLLVGPDADHLVPVEIDDDVDTTNDSINLPVPMLGYARLSITGTAGAPEVIARLAIGSNGPFTYEVIP